MNIYTILFVTFFSISSIVHSEENDYYFGLGATTGSSSLEASASAGGFTVSGSVDYDTSSTPIKIGRIMKNNNRLELSYQSVKGSSGTIAQEKFSDINIDYKMFSKKPIVGSFGPYAVAGVGFYEWKNTAQYFTGNDDLNGIGWNFGVGGVYGLSKNLEIETTVQYKGIEWEDIVASGVTVDLDSSGTELYFGLNYKL